MAAALVATVLATRHTVKDAFAIVGDGQALKDELAVRADIGELEAPPTSAELAVILKDHEDEGVRYIGMLDNHAIAIAEAGTRRPAACIVSRNRLRSSARLIAS